MTLKESELKVGKLKVKVIELADILGIKRIEKQAMEITCEKKGDKVRLLSFLNTLQRIQEVGEESISFGLKEYKYD